LIYQKKGNKKMKNVACMCCLCKDCINRKEGCCDCDICERGDMTVFACNHYENEREDKE
jgi:hypothetical protein